MDKPRLNKELLKSKMLKAIPELNTSNKSRNGIKGIGCPNIKFSSAITFEAKSTAIKKNIME
tara:strand:+ start:321 stop:506 length:186 start_codon:yes stop_codon:yes gene_type:complete